MCCFGIVRGSYYLIMSRLWPRSRGRLATVQVPGFPGSGRARRRPLLVQNTAAFPNVQPLRAALWTESGTVSLSDPGDGAWGIRVTESTGSGPGGSGPTARGMAADGGRPVAGADPVRAVTVTDVMREFGLGTIDLLKVDIEGSEKELFAAPGTGLSTSTPSA